MTATKQTKFTDPSQDPGWDYMGLDGTIHSGNASIAMWTWIRKGFFRPDAQVRKNGADAWATVQDAASGIQDCARPQFAREMLVEDATSSWYWIPPGGEIDTRAYSGGEMLYYLMNGQLPSNAFVCRSTGQNGVPEKKLFKSMGELTDAYINTRIPNKPNITRAQVDSVVSNNVETSAANGHSTVISQTDQHAGTTRQQDEVKTEVWKPNGTDMASALPSFGELQRRYRANVFKDASREWYIYVNNDVHGPYTCSQLLGWSQKNGLSVHYKLASAPIGGPQPANFTDLMELLVDAHRAETSAGSQASGNQ